MTLTQVLDEVFGAELALGLRSGLLVVALALPGALAWRWRRRTPLPAAGLLLVVGTIIGLGEVVVSPSQPDPLAPGLVAALAMLAAGGLAAGLVRAPAVVAMVLATPGAWVIATDGGLADVGWIRLLVGIGAAVGGPLAAAFDRRWRTSGAPPILLAVSVAGLYLTVPETIHVSVVLGVALLVALLGLGAVGCLGSAGAYGAVGLLVWTAAIGGAARPSSIVGGLACLGLLAVEPLVRLLVGGRSPLELIPRRWSLVVLTAIQVVLVATASRVAGVQPSVGVAVVVVLSELALLTVLAARSRTMLRARAGRSDEEEVLGQGRAAGDRV